MTRARISLPAAPVTDGEGKADDVFTHILRRAASALGVPFDALCLPFSAPRGGGLFVSTPGRINGAWPRCLFLDPVRNGDDLHDYPVEAGEDVGGEGGGLAAHGAVSSLVLSVTQSAPAAAGKRAPRSGSDSGVRDAG